MGYYMKLKTIIKNNNSKTINYTFTKDEARIKFPQRLEENAYKFCQLVTDYLYQNNQQNSLRSSVLVLKDKFVVCLKNDKSKKQIIYTIVGDGEKIMEIKNGKQ